MGGEGGGESGEDGCKDCCREYPENVDACTCDHASWIGTDVPGGR